MRTIGVMIVAWVGVFAFVGQAVAQAPQTQPAEQGHWQCCPGGRLTEKLNLTPDQQAQMKTILDKAKAEFQLVLDKTLQVQGSYEKDKSAAFRGFSGLGEVALKRNDFETAQKQFKQALEISPLDQTAAYNVGEIFFSNQKIDEAIAYFEMAIRIKKDWSKPYNRLGVVYLNKGDYAEALEYFNAFLQMDPKSPEAPNVRSMIAAIEKIKK